MPVFRAILLAGAALAFGLAPAAAQGNGHGNAYGHYKGTVTSAGSAAHGSAVAGTGVRNFGSWLDDATVLDAGQGFVSFGVGVWKTPVYREIDVPAVDGGLALNDRVQLGMSLPYALTNEPGGPTARGFGDVYLDAKIQLRAPSESRTGFALIPMVEVLSVEPPSGGGRAHFALPVSVERQGSGWRVMGTGGFFSRGVVFGAGALEVALGGRSWLTGALSHSYSTRQDDLSAALGLRRARTDVSGGLAVAVAPAVSVYGSLGRSISARDSNSASLIASAGVSFGMTRPVR